MSNKNKPIKLKHNQIKWKIVLKGDPTEEPVIWRDKVMTFRTKYAMNELLREIQKLAVDEEYEWMEI